MYRRIQELERAEFDLSVHAANGLRRGRTTGSCATAAVKAALTLLLHGVEIDKVEVSLPDGKHYLVIPILSVRWLNKDTVRADVFKDGGDDPDNTHGAIIFAEVHSNTARQVRFFAGVGVGIARQPGLRVAVGEPAINPVPRQMMRLAVAEVCAELPADSQKGVPDGFDLTIGCENGWEIAQKTFNPRLGIEGGISIIGTSGIVEPMSMASWVASIEVYVRVALADTDMLGRGASAVAYLPGKIGRAFARNVLGLPERRTVQIANFLGDALDFTQSALTENGQCLPVLWLAGHPGKLAKVLDDVWDTHSSKSNMAMNSVVNVAAEMSDNSAWKISPELIVQARQANTVEAVIDIFKPVTGAQALWLEIERRISHKVQQRVPSVSRVEVRLFDLEGNLLGVGHE